MNCAGAMKVLHYSVIQNLGLVQAAGGKQILTQKKGQNMSKLMVPCCLV